MRRLLAATVMSLTTLAILAPVALAHDGGQGLYGETTDKVTTDAGFALIIFFPLFILVASTIQSQLDKRKLARKAAAQKATDEPHGGW
jgi:ABC-type nickel/cobalt efflux system permease component RcnA